MTVLAAAPVTSCRDVPWSRARELAHAAPTPLPARQVALTRAAGLTLAEDLCARQPLLTFDTAAMDGYAVAYPGPWLLSAGAVRAGATEAPKRDWLKRRGGGDLHRGAGAPRRRGGAATGARGAGRGDGTRPGVSSRETPPPGGRGRFIGRVPGAGRGTRVAPAMLGVAVACGHDMLPVRPRARVRILVTGDELIRSGQPAPGQVRDALGPLLPPLVHTLGGEVTDVRPVPDHPVGSLATVVLTTSYDTEVIVVTGSTSVGATDQLRRLLVEHGARWVVDAVAVRPGHPQLLAQLPDRRWIVGLPGNPYAALTAAHTLLAPLLAGLTGRPLPALPRIPLTGDITAAPGRTRLIPVTWDGATACPVGGHRPAFLHGAALADALAAVPPDWQPHTQVPLILLTG
nr:molybdopterin-binding protein [Streptomyces sp. S1D4-11]QIY93396.1 molybdopterin molybdenumtransferase MoeA [Streptomyces sp. S1D4-11]